MIVRKAGSLLYAPSGSDFRHAFLEDGMGTEGTRVTDVLERWSAGDRGAAEEAFPLVYRELRRIAAREFRRERDAHTLQPTAVVHEAYLRLRESRGLTWASRAQFFAFAAHVMRRVLVDHARERARLKRGGGLRFVTLDVADRMSVSSPPDLLALDEALEGLALNDPRKASIVELRVFAGFGMREIAAQLGISEETVGREWRRAKAWLRARLEPVPSAHDAD